ncbi:MAG: ATP-binding cassette domain-containing protein, partial [Planctomycetota bacterium]
MIEIRGLSRWFGSTCAVRNLSLAVPAGSVLGFIGPNGAGKTTTMRILATLDGPDLGDALVDGFSVVDDADRVRSRIGYVPDAYGAYANVSCVEYL